MDFNYTREMNREKRLSLATGIVIGLSVSFAVVVIGLILIAIFLPV